MSTKLIKRANGKDVFDQIAEQNDGAGVEPVPDIPDVAAVDETPAGDVTDTPDDDDGDTRDDQTEHDDSQNDDAEHSGRRRWLRRTAAAVAGVVFLAALGLAGYLGWQFKQNADIHNAGRAALVTAEHYAVTLTSIDTNNVDQNFTQVLDGATGQFKDMYSQSASQLRQVLIDNKAMSKGIVVDSAIKSATKTKVQVLIFIDQSITNTVNPQPRIDRSRVAMTMELVDGHWLASDVELK